MLRSGKKEKASVHKNRKTYCILVQHIIIHAYIIIYEILYNKNNLQSCRPKKKKNSSPRKKTKTIYMSYIHNKMYGWRWRFLILPRLKKTVSFLLTGRGVYIVIISFNRRIATLQLPNKLPFHPRALLCKFFSAFIPHLGYKLHII